MKLLMLFMNWAIMPLSESAKRFRFGNAEPSYLVDYDSNGNLIYEGYSSPGTPETTAGFTIMKHVYQAVTISGATIYEDIYSSILDKVIWDLRTMYNFP